MFEYSAQIIAVIDGDSITARVDFGFRISQVMRLRLNGLNTPELNSTNETERALAIKAKERLIELVLNKPVILKTFRDRQEKFGRYLAVVCDDTGRNINQMMIDEGLAKPYSGGKR